MLLDYPHAHWRVFVDWVNKLPFDGTVATGWAAKTFGGDARVTQFYDPRDWAGKAVATALGKPGQSAWDIYLFYPPGARWDGAPPPPLRWMHQLGWLDPAHHHSGADLSRQLQRAAQADLAIAAPR